MSSYVPLLAVGGPLAGALVIAIWARSRSAQRAVALGTSVLALAAVTWIYLRLRAGEISEWRVPGPLGTPVGLALRWDGLGAVLGVVAAYLWLAATIYSWTYMRHGEGERRYWVTWLVVLAGTLGVAGAADYVTLLLCFELMSLVSYLLVVHNRSPEAVSAGETYLYMSVFAGIALLTGIATMQHYLGTTVIAPSAELLAALPPAARWSIVGLMGTGFALKAGALPLHVWLPRAHPVAPSPASALLSGVMIKVGAFGLMRIALVMLAPVIGPGAAARWDLAQAAGLFLIWLAVPTMLAGVTMALLQQNAKRMLAYHSISQMGYILLGVGVAAYLGPEGAVGFGGAIMHLVNHALFKGCLFLAVGAVVLYTGEVNMYRLGGLWRRMPFTAVACLVAAAGISGVPGLNGYASKTLLHHAVVEAAHAGPAALLWAERLFVLTGVGTAASFVKLFSLIFLGRTPEHRRVRGEDRRDETTAPPLETTPIHEELPLKVGMALLAVCIVAIGLLPNAAMGAIVGPAGRGLGFDSHALEHTLVTNVFTPGDLLSVVTTILFGALVFWVGLRKGWFHLHGPRWLSIEWLAIAAGRAVGRAWLCGAEAWEATAARLDRRVKLGLRRAARALPLLDYIPGRTEAQREFNLLNLDFDFYLVLGVIAVVLLLMGWWQLRG